jgi:hypothetical protein
MADLRFYPEAAPANIECDVADRATADFQSKLFRVSVDRCLLRVARATAVQEQSCAAVEEGEFTDTIVCRAQVRRASIHSMIVSPTSRSARIQVRPNVLPDSLPGDMKLQMVTFRYKRGFGQKCIYDDDVYP